MEILLTFLVGITLFSLAVQTWILWAVCKQLDSQDQSARRAISVFVINVVLSFATILVLYLFVII
jgi:hypothetical protein